ncbi:MAG: HAD-IA family hydrolase [Bowdeniella nasicola]|nr:HAD-IA family hydrolase [Bowdeniella nasicola]
MRHVVWDMGGTLIDTYPEVDRALARAVHGPEPTVGQLREVAHLTRISSAHAIGELATRYGVDESRVRAAYDDLKALWRRDPAPVMPGAREVMAAVRAAGKLNLVVTHRDRASATTLLEGHGLQVDDMVCAPDGYRRKPDPQMFVTLLNRHQLTPSDVIAVGDRAIDGAAAQAAGVRAYLLVTPGIAVPTPHASAIAHLTELLP